MHLSTNEENIVLNYYLKPNNEEAFKSYQKALELNPSLNEIFQEYSKIDVAIDPFKTTKTNENDWQKFLDFKKKRNRFVFPSFIKFAAAIIVLFMFSWYFFQQKQEQNQTFTAQHQVLELTLDDGSQVILNAGSTLTIENNFSKDKRKLNFNGEALFKVAKANSEFIIESKKGTVLVTGTEFLFNSQEKNIELYEGSVSYILYQDTISLVAGQAINNGVLLPSQQKIEKPEWLDNSLEFKDMELEKVIQSLSLYSSKEIKCSQDIARWKINLYVDTLNEKRILYLLENSANLKIKETEKYFLLKL